MLKLDAATGSTDCQLQVEGGVALLWPHAKAEIGEASMGMKLVTLKLEGSTLWIDADVLRADQAVFRVRTPWKMEKVEGAKWLEVSPHIYELNAGFEKGAASRRVIKASFERPQ